ncbi:uncharacterized protein BJ212DRAFT_57264 [Suillus subaureus]|uniref:Uncharacterized protein n=1 Tax=Suillus subaureus TaxID=48587 RepID=A0A9P7JK78_9AGAM|nr:uncharacterized protein BJ212DRAFT_57264 [Suillus subaureus]KAG1827514.1 hypothetical protein BJ212DRAFT_57264 [Suillus subaureus]
MCYEGVLWNGATAPERPHKNIDSRGLPQTFWCSSTRTFVRKTHPPEEFSSSIGVSISSSLSRRTEVSNGEKIVIKFFESGVVLTPIRGPVRQPCAVQRGYLESDL